ncbi:MAG: RNA polymerase sigma factor [Patescibacteria group bacterium]
MSKYYLELEDEIKIGGGEDLKDEDLVLKSLQNPRLFEVFVDRYKDSFLRTAMRVLKGKEESEDVVQEAFVKIYFNAKKYQKRPGIAFKSWAFRILMNCVFTKYRKLKKTFCDTEYLDQFLYIIDDSSDFSKKEKVDEIESVLKEMPDDLGDLIRDHYLKDRPYVEVASDYGMSIAALKMKLFRARKKFKEVMEGISN